MTQEPTTIDIDMWSVQFNRLRLHLEETVETSRGPSMKTSQLAEIFTMEEYNMPRMNFIFPNRHNLKYSVPIMMSNLEEVFRPESVLLSYQAKNCDQIISLAIEPYLNVYHVNQLAVSL